MAFLAAIVSCQLFEKDDTTPSSGWLGGLFHHNGKPDSSLPESMEWSTEVPTSSTPSSYWSYFSLGHHTTPSSLLRLRRAAQGQYGYRPYNRPYNRYPNQAYNQGGNRPYYYQRPIETTTPPKNIYMPGNGPAMPVASSTFPPQFGLGVTYKNGATVKPTTSTANPAAAWYSNWLNSLPDSVKSLYGVTTTKPPQGLVGRRRRRSLSRLARRRRSAEEDMASSIEGSSLHNHGHHHHHHHEDTSPAPEIENSTADAEASTQGLRNKLRRKRSAEEEEVSTRTPCHHKHSPAPHMMEEISRRRRSAEEDMASTECSSLHHHHRHHHHEDASQAPEIASSPSALSRRRRSAEDLASTEGLTDALDLSTESTTTTDDSSEDASTEPILKATKTKPRFRRAVEEIKSSTQGPISMIAIEGLNETSTASDQEMKLSTSAPTLR